MGEVLKKPKEGLVRTEGSITDRLHPGHFTIILHVLQSADLILMHKQGNEIHHNGRKYVRTSHFFHLHC